MLRDWHGKVAASPDHAIVAGYQMLRHGKVAASPDHAIVAGYQMLRHGKVAASPDHAIVAGYQMLHGCQGNATEAFAAAVSASCPAIFALLNIGPSAIHQRPNVGLVNDSFLSTALQLKQLDRDCESVFSWLSHAIQPFAMPKNLMPGNCVGFRDHEMSSSSVASGYRQCFPNAVGLEDPSEPLPRLSEGVPLGLLGEIPVPTQG